MSEMIERVARAIAKYEAKGGHPFTTDQREIDRAIARVAIEAMREPTIAMDMAAEDAVAALTMGDLAEGDSENIVTFRAMIDEALK